MRGALRLRRSRESGGRSAPFPKARPFLKAPSPSCAHHRYPFRPPLPATPSGHPFRPTAPLTASCALKCTPTPRITPSGLSSRPLSPTRNDTPTIGHPPSTSHGPMVTRGTPRQPRELANSKHSVEPNAGAANERPIPAPPAGQHRQPTQGQSSFSKQSSPAKQPARRRQKRNKKPCTQRAGSSTPAAISSEHRAAAAGAAQGGRLFSRGGR